ncbi:MAG: hypothetical protein IJH47_01515 [Oscillospiraceae bacterium]|nr:hypothetical protein [Oscillospiraceae bacterium]
MKMTETDYKHLPITKRIEAIRKAIIHAEPTVCSERAQIVTGTYKATEGKPVEIRRAMAVKAVLENMTIHL